MKAAEQAYMQSKEQLDTAMGEVEMQRAMEAASAEADVARKEASIKRAR